MLCVESVQDYWIYWLHDNLLLTDACYQVRAPEDYQLILRTPPDCNLTNCTTYIGIDINAGNNGFLDIYMEGEALGWVAVGFTQTRNMVQL